MADERIVEDKSLLSDADSPSVAAERHIETHAVTRGYNFTGGRISHFPIVLHGPYNS